MIFDDLLKEFLRRRKFLDGRKFFGLFQDFDDIIPQMKLGALGQLFPELVEEYGESTDINIFLNTHDIESDEVKEDLHKGNKVTFKKDLAEAQITFTFELRVRNAENPFEWDLIRKGELGVFVNAQIKMSGPS